VEEEHGARRDVSGSWSDLLGWVDLPDVVVKYTLKMKGHRTVTNQEWRRCKDPMRMIEGLKDVASGRKGILYLCGCCRLVWELLYDDSSKEAVDVAERYADGLATYEELRGAEYGAECPTFGYDFEPRIWRRWGVGVPNSVQNLVKMGVLTEQQLEEDEPEVDPVVKSRLMAAAALADGTCSPDPFGSGWWTDSISVVDSASGEWLLRCVFNKPFLPPVMFDSDWTTPTVASLAEAIYSERAFDRMPILGDALEEAGCNNVDILSHCRSDKPHIRGCWVVDLVLGKS
jgi:hypothetical protein